MNPRQRAQLEALLKSLPKSEQDRLFREAAAQRAEDQKRRRADRRKTADLDLPRAPTGKRKTDPVREYVLKLLAREQAGGAHASSPGREPGVRTPGTPALAEETPHSRAGLELDAGLEGETPGIAVFVGKRRCLVRPDAHAGDEDHDVECRLPAELAGRQQSELCVGDRVTFTSSSDDRREANEIARVIPRTTVLTRRDPRTGEARAIVANVDAVVIVVSVVSPPLHPRLIDRYLIAIEDSWVEAPGAHADDPDPAQAILVVNKTDLLETLEPGERDAELSKLDPYRALGVSIVECSAASARGIDELRAILAGKTVALVGHSGVGKSSIANALDPRLGARVERVGAAANRGRHTTTSSQLYRIDHAPGGVAHEPFHVIDTPGIRHFALEELTPAQLRDSFPELRALRRGCRFNDCTHTHEPGCAVLDAVQAGRLHAARYDAYRRLLEEIDRGPGLPTQRIRPLPEPE